jgi:hypothetical protein
MTVTKRAAILALTAALQLALAWRSPALALINLDTTPTGGGAGTFTTPDVIYPSDDRVQRTLKSTGLSDIRVSWTDHSQADVSTVIERSVTSAGAWTALYTFTTSLDGPQSYVDADLSPDSEYCYRIRIRGATTQVVSWPRCVVTQQRNDPGVWRTQLRVRVADVSSAGTNGRVSISLNGGPWDIPHGAWTGINSPIDDFERNSDVTYELIQTGIATLRDITRVQLYTQSTDAFCVRDLQLLVNGVVAFEKVFGNTTTTCRWVDGSHTLLIPHAELRASALFTGYVSPAPSFVVPTDEIAARLGAIVGSMLWERTEVHWRDPGPFTIPNSNGQQWSPGPAVEVSRKTEDTIHVDLHMVGNDWPNPDITLSLDLLVAFVPANGGWELAFTSSGFKADVDFPWFVDLLVNGVCSVVLTPVGGALADCMGAIESYIAEQIEDAFEAPTQRVPIALDPSVCAVPAVRVATDGALVFSCAQARTTTKIIAPIATRGVLLR